MPSVMVLGETPMLWGSRNILVMCSLTLMPFSIMPVLYSDEIEMWLNSLWGTKL